jgi:hypothetical protein
LPLRWAGTVLRVTFADAVTDRQESAVSLATQLLAAQPKEESGTTRVPCVQAACNTSAWANQGATKPRAQGAV